MIALAIRDILPEARVLYAIRNNIPHRALIRYLLPPNYLKTLHPDYPKMVYINLPREVFRAMLIFDTGAAKTEIKYDALVVDENLVEARKLIKPFEFEINIPNVLIDMIGISQVYKILSESRTLEHINETL